MTQVGYDVIGRRFPTQVDSFLDQPTLCRLCHDVIAGQQLQLLGTLQKIRNRLANETWDD